THRVPALLNVTCPKQPMLECAVRHIIHSCRTQTLGKFDLGRWIGVIQNGLDARETSSPDHLLAIQRAIGFSKLCMPLVRNLTEFVVKRHDMNQGRQGNKETSK